jgi:hypothetical protein
VQAILKAFGVLPQVMQQPSEPSFSPEVQRLGKPFRQLCYIAQVRGQPLPFRHIPVRRPVRSHCGMRVIHHFVLRFPSDPAASVVALAPLRDKRFLSRGWTRAASPSRDANYRTTHLRPWRGPASNPTRWCLPGSLSYNCQTDVGRRGDTWETRRTLAGHSP